jgi:hypothetical protein
MLRAGFEPPIPVFERAKTFQALNRAVTIIGVTLVIFDIKELGVFNL